MSTTTQPMPAKPVEQTAKQSDPSKVSEENLLNFIRERAFVFWYRSRYKPTSAYILAPSLEKARERADTYCDRFGLRFISVHPMYLDLNKKPEDTVKVADT